MIFSQQQKQSNENFKRRIQMWKTEKISLVQMVECWTMLVKVGMKRRPIRPRPNKVECEKNRKAEFGKV